MSLKCKKYSVDSLSLKRLPLLTCLIVFCLDFGLHAQNNSSGSSQSKVLTALDEFQNRFLDWVVLAYATYTGQHDAELESIFAKAKSGLDKQPDIQKLLNEIQDISGENGLNQVVRDFTNKTGIGIYFVPQIVNNDDGFYVPILNNFLAEGAKNPVAPYVMVKPVIDGNNKDGYNISYSIETSPNINPKKYNLDRACKSNPFHAIAGQAAKRKDLITKLRPNLARGVISLTNTVDENFLPKLVITYDGNVYRPEEKIELGMESNPMAKIRLIAKNRDGSTPKRAVRWSIYPETVERKVQGSHLLFPQSQAGLWAIMAESGANKATVDVKVVNFNLDWKPIVKNILYELLRNELDRTKIKIDSMEALGPGYNADLKARLKEIEAANYPLESDGSQWHSLYDQPRVLSERDAKRFYSNKTRARGFRHLTKFKKHAINTLRQVNLAAFIDILIEKPNRFDLFFKGFTDYSASHVLEIVAAGLESHERDEKIREVVINYLNANLESLADSEFAAKHYEPRLAAQAIPQASSTIPDTQDPNFYISPLVEFPEKQAFTQELKATLETMANPPFVVINYSQDLSEESYLARAPKGRPKGIPQEQEYVVVAYINSPGSVKETIVTSDSTKVSVDESGSLVFNIEETALEIDLTYDYFVSDSDAWQRTSKSPYSTIEPTLEKPKIEQGAQVAVLQTVKDKKEKDVAMMRVKDETDTLYTTLSNLSKVEKLSKELKYKMKEDFEALKLPYGADKAGKKYTKDDTFTALKKCGDYVRVKSEGEDKIEGHWISKDSTVVDCGTGFCCQECGEDLTLDIATLQSIYGTGITASYIEPLNTALKKGGFNTHTSHAHFFAQSKVEVGSSFSLDEIPNYRVHKVLELHRDKKSLENFYKQSFWDDETYLDYFQFYVFKKADSTFKGSRYQGTSEKTYTWAHNSSKSIKVPTSFIEKKDEKHQKVTLTSSEKEKRNKKLFSYLYANKYGNGAPSTEDGWNFRGKGLIHLTWKSNYKSASNSSSNKLDYAVDWTTNYDKVSDSPKDAVYSAVGYFLFKLNTNAKFKLLHDDSKVRDVSKLVNGLNPSTKQPNGWSKRRDNFNDLIGNLFKCEEL